MYILRARDFIVMLYTTAYKSSSGRTFHRSERAARSRSRARCAQPTFSVAEEIAMPGLKRDDYTDREGAARDWVIGPPL